MGRENKKTGMLYIIATPIGNLADISLRALDTLKSLDVLYAEDTRNTKKLLTHYSIQKKMVSLHEHNEAVKIDEISQRLDAGEQVGLVSDAGTPLISDPGFQLVRELTQQGYSVTTIPGASAIIAALSIAGLPTDAFSFQGFLPSKPANKKRYLESAKDKSETLVFYESSHRIKDTLSVMSEMYRDRNIAVARELTKLFEQVFRGTCEQAENWIVADDNHRKGEFVIMLEGLSRDVVVEKKALSEDDVLDVLSAELSAKQASAMTAKIFGTSKNALYKRIVAKQK